MSCHRAHNIVSMAAHDDWVNPRGSQIHRYYIYYFFYQHKSPSLANYFCVPQLFILFLFSHGMEGRGGVVGLVLQLLYNDVNVAILFCEWFSMPGWNVMAQRFPT